MDKFDEKGHAACACRHVEYRNNDTNGRVTKEWWQCRDCGTIFVKEQALRDVARDERARAVRICKELWQAEVDSMAGTPPGSTPDFNDAWTQALEIAMQKIEAQDDARTVVTEAQRTA